MLDLPKDEMAFRKIYKDLLESEKITTVFRPGKRDCGDFRGYCPAQIVDAKVLDSIGADWAKVAPKFLEGFLRKIKIKSVEIKTLGALRKEDFSGSSPDVQDIESLIYHLGLIYNLEKGALKHDSVVTKITFEYI